MMPPPHKPHLSHHVAKIIPRPVSGKSPASYVFISVLEAPVSRRALGDVYVVMELLAPAKKAKPICDLVVTALSHEFYEAENGAGAGHEQRFEHTINAVNRALKDYGAEQPDETLSGLSGLVLNLADDQIMSAQAGQANVILFRGEQSHNVFETGNSAKQNSFANIASGRVEAEDTLLLATPAYLVEADMNEVRLLIGTNQDLHQLIQAIEQSLSQSEQAYRSGLVVIRLSDYEDIAHSVLPSQKTTLLTGEAEDLVKKTGRQSAKIINNVVKNTMKFVKFVWQKLKTLVIPKFTQLFQQIWNRLWSKYINKNPRLAAGITAMTIVLILIAFFAIIKPHNNLDGAITLYKQADLHYLSAQEALTGNDEAGAETAIGQANAAIAKIKTNDPAGVETAIKKDPAVVDKISIDQLKSRIAALSDKITATLRPKPSLVADFTSSKSTLNQITLLSNQLYALQDKPAAAIIQVDLASKKTTTTPTQLPVHDVIATTTDASRGIIYYLTSKPAVWAYDTATHGAYQVQLSSGNWEKSLDIAFYNNNLYLLSPANSQVFRHNPTSIGFGPGVNYIKQASISLNQITSLAINGSIFVGDSSDHISTFSLGLQSNFSVHGLPSELGWPTKLLLSSKSSQLIALNNHSNRIYTISLTDQAGIYKSQYAPSGISQIQSIAASGDQTSIYFVSSGESSRIYNLSL